MSMVASEFELANENQELFPSQINVKIVLHKELSAISNSMLIN